MNRVLFVCVHNAGRSIMAEALFNHKVKSQGLDFVAESAGTAPSGSVNPAAIQALTEIGISESGLRSKALTQAMANQADLIVTMGCGVDATACPAKFLITEDWGLNDPHGQDLDAVRAIRDEIAVRVDELIARMVLSTESRD